MNWDDYRYFLAVTRNRTLKAASVALKVDQATVGRRLTALQASIGSVLLEKRSDGYFLTSAGAKIFESVEAIENEMLSINRAIFSKDEKLEGVVKVAMPGALANQWLIVSLSGFLKKHPGLEIQFLTGAEVLNLSRREADLALRLVRPNQKELKTRKIGRVQLGLYRSVSFDPDTIEDSPFIGLFDKAMSELERVFLRSLKFEPRYQLRSAAWSSVLAGLKAGLGIGILPTFIGDRHKDLRLIQLDRNETPLWLVVHPEVAQSARVRSVIEHFAKVLK